MPNSNLEIITTADGSKSIFNAEIGENYHSKHGAMQESAHVFVNAGFRLAQMNFPNQKIKILEVGLGTGLNYLMSRMEAENQNIELEYTGIEAFPLPVEMIAQLDYQQFIPAAIWQSYLQDYTQIIQHQNQVKNLHIAVNKLFDFESDTRFQVLYFDAFSQIHQPEMWTAAAIEYAAKFLVSGGIFVTYAITGHLKRTLKAAGFTIEKLSGAPGKREMLRAIKG